MKMMIIMRMVIKKYLAAIQNLISEQDWTKIGHLTPAMTLKYPSLIIMMITMTLNDTKSE